MKPNEGQDVLIPYSFWSKNQNKKNTTTYDNVIARKTSMDEAVFVRRFIWHYDKWKGQNADRLVFIVPEAFAEPVGMSVYAFRKIVKKWESLKIIETVTKGIPMKKYYKLNEKALATYLTRIYNNTLQVIENDKIGYRKRQDKVIENDKIYNTEKILNQSNTSRRGKTPARQVRKANPVPSGSGTLHSRSSDNLGLVPEVPQQETIVSKVATLLHTAIKKHGFIMRVPNTVEWQKTLLELHDSLSCKKPWAKIKEAIALLDKYLGTQGWPEICSADSFAKKFDQIFAAARRQKEKENGVWGKFQGNSNENASTQDDSKPNDGNKQEKGTPCSECHQTKKPVYHVFHPYESYYIRLCKCCFNKFRHEVDHG